MSLVSYLETYEEEEETFHIYDVVLKNENENNENNENNNFNNNENENNNNIEYIKEIILLIIL